MSDSVLTNTAVRANGATSGFRNRSDQDMAALAAQPLVGGQTMILNLPSYLMKTYRPANHAHIPGTRLALNDRQALIWLLGLSLNARAANMVVTNLADNGPGTLRDAIAAANTNADADVITFDAALDGQVILLTNAISGGGTLISGELMLSNNVTIDASALSNGIAVTAFNTAQPSPIEGTGGFRVFEVASNAVVELDHLTIQGGSAYLDTSQGNPSSPDYTGLFSSACGGGIFVNGGPSPGAALTLNDCTLSGNYAQFDGGALAVGRDPGSGSPSALALTLNRCTISRNSAAYGGGIFLTAYGTNIVNNSTLTGNAASTSGGGIFTSQGTGVILNNSTLYNNLAIDAGGGFCFYLGTLKSLNNCTLTGNSADQGGGGYFFLGTSTTFNNSTISGNVAYTQGGGLYNQVATFGPPSLTNSIVAGNTAPLYSNLNAANSGVNSLTNGNPLLAPLGNYGGPTLTMPPLAGSPAIDAGTDAVTNFLAADQRGYPRLSGAHVDLGAVELQGVSANNAPVLKLTFTSSPNADFTVLASTNIALQPRLWTPLGLALQNPPGQYQFTDRAATNYLQRFYQVVSPWLDF
jgi:hypothetical protein